MTAYEKNILGLAAQLTPVGLTFMNGASLARGGFDAIVIAGMGGSGLAGQIIVAARRELGLRVPVVIWKDYGLPELIPAPKRPLFIFVSFSGNTEETVSGLKAALAKKQRVAVVATGNTLEKIARAKRLPFVHFDAGILTPRQSVGRMFYAIVEILSTARLLAKRPGAYTHLSPASFRPAAVALVPKLVGRTVAVYTDGAHANLGYLWKIKLNETAKVHAFANVLPEMNHNELTAFDGREGSKKMAALFLETPRLSPRMAKRFRITKKLMEKRGARVITISLPESSPIEQAWHTLIMADWTTYALGRRTGVPDAEFNIVNPAIVIDLKRHMG